MPPAAVATEGCRHLVRPSPLLPPIVLDAVTASRYKDVILERCTRTVSTRKPLPSSQAIECKFNLLANPIVLSSTNSQGHCQELHSWSSTDKPLTHLSAVSALSFGGDQGVFSHAIPTLPRRHRSPLAPRAYKSDAFSFRLPVTTEKPEWWWRTLACVPYLIALQISDTGYYLQPFLEHYGCLEDLIYYVPGAITRLPSWFTVVYCYFAYLGVVKNKEWPHFFRFHLMMGMLLETALHVVWYTSNFMPLIHYTGKLGMHYWAAVGFTYIFILMACVRCALAGTYAHIPFVSEAALIHTVFTIGGFHRPF